MRMPSRPIDVRKKNVRLVLSCVRDNDALSRTDIATQTQLSPASCDLNYIFHVWSGLTIESEHNKSLGRGRPPKCNCPYRPKLLLLQR